MWRRACVQMGRAVLCFVVGLLALPGVAVAGDVDVGVEWINKFPDNPSCDRLYNRDNCAKGLYNYFKFKGWKGRFCNGNDNAWEEHWKEASSGGTDGSYCDRCDIAMIATHGNSGGFSFNSRHDDQWLSRTEARWGDDDDLEWIILDACSCLASATHANWQTAFARLHTILGFDTNAHDKRTRGFWFAYKAFRKKSVVQSWWYACEVTEGSGTDAAAMGVYRPNDTYSDRIHGKGSVARDSSSPTSFWYYSHNCD